MGFKYKLNIFQWNSQSVRPKRIEFEQLLCSEKVHIAAISETWLNTESTFKISSYNIYRQDREDSYGGVAIFTHNSVKTQLVPVQLSNLGIEVICVKVFNCQYIDYIISIYCPPSTRTSLSDWNEIFSFKTVKTLVLGDFNGHHPSWSCKTDLRGTHIFDSLMDNNFISLNDCRPTRIKYVNGILQKSSPDISIASSDLALHLDWNVTNESLGSDHLIVKINISYCNNNSQFIKKRNYNKADWEGYSKYIDSKLCNLNLTDVDPQISYDLFLSMINEAADAHIPFYRISQEPTQNFNPKPYWNTDLSRAVAERRLALTLFRQNSTPDNLDKLKEKISSSQSLIRRAKQKFFSSFCSSIDETTTVLEMWRKMKWLKGYKSSRGYYVDESMANKLLHSITPDFVCPKYPIFSSTNAHIESPFSLCELKKCIKTKDTSPGIDNVSYSMIKHLPDNAFTMLLKMFNLFYTISFVPSQWREIRIIPIPKIGRDPSSVSALRPISLITCFCKIFHAMITHRLEWFVENGNHLFEETTGFRKSKSCLDNLSNLVTRVQTGFSNNQFTLACFLDIENAYNNIDITTLLFNLDKLGVGSKICKYLWTFLKERHLSVQVSNIVLTRSTSQGIAQGDPLSPLLFNIATLHICKQIPNVMISQYADDYALYVTSENVNDASDILQSALDQIHGMLINLGLEISPTKTKICMFKKGINRQPISLNIRNNTIEVVSAVKYLGMWLDCRLKWNKHIAELETKVSRFLNIFKILAGSGWGVHPKHLKRLYIAIIRSRLDYGSFLYNNSCKKYLYKLDKIQNQALRVIGGFIKTTPIHAMESELGLPPLHLRRAYLGGKYILKARSQENNVTIKLIKKLLQFKDNRYWRNKLKPLLLTVYEDLADIHVHSSQKLEMFSMSTWTSNIDLSEIVSLKIPSISKAKRKYNSYSLKLTCLKFINQQYIRFYQLFTDGSKDRAGIGSAFFDPQCDVSMKLKIDNNVICIMEAELIAISEALSYAASIQENNIVIFTDSKSALQHLVRCTSGIRGTPTAYKILDGISELISRSKVIKLQWIPSHCGIDCNEKVDFLARQASTDGVEYLIYPYYADCICFIKKQCYKLWNEYFDLRSREKGIWYKTVQPEPLNVPWMDNHALPRKDAVVIMRLRSGHIPSKKFAFLMGKVPSPNCDQCGVPEDLLHVLMECVRNAAFRIDHCKDILKSSADCNIILSNPYSDEVKLLIKLYNIIFSSDQSS